jgi:cellulose biosynthesis protein BcsQ
MTDNVTNAVKLFYTPDGAVAPARVIVVGAQKGGVGKTTVTAGVAHTLYSSHGRHVVLLDSDYQGGLTRLLGARASQQPLTDAPVVVHGMSLFAAGTTLRHATRAQIVAHIDRAVAFAAGGVLTVDLRPDLLDDFHAALFARPDVFILAVPEVAPASIPEIRKLAAMAEARGRDYLIVGNKDSRKSTAKRARGFLQAGFPEQLSNIWIPSGKQADQAFELGRPVTAVDPDAPVAVAVRAVADHLVARGAA